MYTCEEDDDCVLLQESYVIDDMVVTFLEWLHNKISFEFILVIVMKIAITAMKRIVMINE